MKLIPSGLFSSIETMKVNHASYRVKSDQSVSLSEFSCKAPFEMPENMPDVHEKNRQKIGQFQNKLYAENKQSLLIILQGMDGAGKDSTIRHIMSGVNPQGVQVHSFKHPSDLELSHDYLWRHYMKLPEQGQIGIFNRSHYENVLISKVHPEYVLAERIPGIEKLSHIDSRFWKNRYQQIRNFEDTISETGTVVLKFFLHLSKNEQKKRFLERIDKKEKHWKFSKSDIVERGYWKEYQKAYEKSLENTSTKRNAWYVIPADDKWFGQLLISEIVLDTLKGMKIKFPIPDEDQEKRLMEARILLLNEK